VPVSDVDAVALGNGRVLVAGGTAGDGTPTAATALFDPTGNSWSAGPSLGAARELHTTTPLGDGRVLVAGGRGTDGAALASAEIYDPAANAWSTVPGPLSAARYGHTATALNNGTVLVAGGTGAHGGPLAGTEIFAPATGAWTPATPMLDARTGHRAVPLDETRVLVAGGALPTGETGGAAGALTYCEVYDTLTGLWTATGSLATARKGHQATPLGDGRVLVTGGDAVTAVDGTYDPHSLATTELYDPATGVWTTAAALPGGRSGHRGLLTRAGVVLVLGGTGGPGHTAGFRYVAAYNPGADRWTTRAGLRTGRSAFGVVELADTRVLVAGGTAAAGAAAPGASSAPAAGAEALIP
jgi:galactose oxidase-like protein